MISIYRNLAIYSSRRGYYVTAPGDKDEILAHAPTFMGIKEKIDELPFVRAQLLAAQPEPG